MKRIDLFINTCSEFGLREEELIEMLNNASLRHLSLFDEIINMNIEEIQEIKKKGGFSRL